MAPDDRAFIDLAGPEEVNMEDIRQDLEHLELALLESKEKFRIFYESVNDAMYIIDMQGILIDCNPMAHIRLGYSKDEMIGRSVAAFDDPESAARVAERMAQIARLGSAIFEVTHVKKDGTVLPVEVNAKIIEYAGRQMILSVMRDITERRRLENSLKAAVIRADNERIKSESILSAIGVGLSIQDRDYRIQYQNQAQTDLIGNHLGELCYEAYEKRAQRCDGCPVARVFEDGGVHTVPRSAPTDNGDIHVEITASALRDAQGDVVAAIEVVRDVTERKALEEELFRSKQDWEYTFNSITDMVTVHDKDFNIIRANKAAEKILGLPLLDQMKQRKCYAYFHGATQPPKECPSCGCLISGSTAEFEVFEPHLNMFIEIRAIPRLDSSGNMIGLIHIVRDITERKKTEEERDHLRREKEQLREQLLQSQKMEAVGTLAGGIAHDFNNILNVIVGYSGLLENMSGMPKRAEEFLAEITRAATRAADLTRGLLAFSRKQHLELKPADLNGIIRRMSGMLHRIIGEDIHIKTDLHENDLVIICDSGQIEQVIVNLAANARDAMPEGGLLSLKTEAVEIDEDFLCQRKFGAAGRYAVLHLTDTGIGMDEETVQRIFEPFFTTKEVGKGTGLGLSITYGIVMQHKGFLECRSEPGAGTVFSVYLPIALTSASVEREKEKMLSLSTGKGVTILVAEDDESGRQLIRKVLEHQGYRVIEAANGVEVIEKFREHSRDIALMLLDVIMPGMNGYDALAIIRQQHSDIKAVLMSGYTADILEERGYKELPVLLLKKPLSPHELLKAVREVLES